jgi:mono/diheme cytochrome c family protein
MMADKQVRISPKNIKKNIRRKVRVEMRRRPNQSIGKSVCVVSVVVLAIVCAAVLSNAKPQQQSEPDKVQLERGRYLVQQVGLCGDCHTPRDEKGQPVEGKYLQGAPIMLKPTVSMPSWGGFAPPIAGLPGFTDTQAVTFLTTGKDASGKFSAPPMPPYRFSEKDAAAVIAYLRSLAPKQ